MKQIDALRNRILARDPGSFNTDWNGALVVWGLLEWARKTKDKRGDDLARAWFEYHCRETSRLTDAELYATFEGNKARVIREGPIPFTAYCAHWGIILPMERLSKLLGDSRPVQVADAIADFITHRAACSSHGCLFHDDGPEFLIPDVCYLSAPPLAVAGKLTGKLEYTDEAASQVLAYADLMQNRKNGLAHTWWDENGMPDNFWTRATGWLAGAYAFTLENLPKDHPACERLAEGFARLADGIMAVQRSDGGFHVLLDRPDTPVDCTGPAMMAVALHVGVQLGVLEAKADAAAQAAWQAAARHVDEEGKVTGAYTGWAKSALEERFEPDIFDRPGTMDFVPGLLLLTDAVFTPEP